MKIIYTLKLEHLEGNTYLIITKKEEGNIKVQCKKEEFNKKNVIPKTGIFILSWRFVHI